MTSFKEEFFGCRFRRDRVRKCDMPDLPSCCARDKKVPVEGGNVAKTPSFKDQVLISVETKKDFESEELMGRVTQRLHDMQHSLALSVLTHLQPQISELDTRVRSLKQSRLLVNAKTAVAAADLDPAHIATIVSSALSSRFEDLACQTAAASAAVELIESSNRANFQSSQHAISADLVKELLPHIICPLERAIEDTLRPRLQELEESLVASKTKQKRTKSSIVDCQSRESSRYNGIVNSSEQMLKRQWPIGVVKRQSSRSYNKLPRRAFVVNFRRLVEVQKILALIHEFIQSTAIATLTLVAAATWSQLVFSILFVGLVLILFAVHEGRHDKMDIEDYKSLVQLLEDDDGVCNNQTIQNPNRVLKALTLSEGNHRRTRSFIAIVLCLLILLIVWLNVFCSWAYPPSDDLWLGIFNFEDRMVQATLLLVGTAMVVFHISFEWLYWRETQCVMPTCGDRAWDPRRAADSVPSQYSWFGLPSMWFTSREAYDDLRLWITLSRKDGDAALTRIHPEEMALLALQPEGASFLRKTLADAKLFSMGCWEFLARNAKKEPMPVKKGEEPEKLGISFVFFDRLSETFLQPGEDYHGGVMRLLTRTNSSSSSAYQLKLPAVEASMI